MKKISLIAAIIALSQPSYAQWTTAGNNTIHSNSGYVGIGLNNPSTPLDVAGEIRAGSFRTLGGPGDNVNGSPWYGLGTSNKGLPGSPNNVVQLAGFAGLNFQSAGGIVVLNTAGYLGVGLEDPDQRLVVNGNIKAMLSGVAPTKNVVGLFGLGYSGITGAQNWALRGVYQHAFGVGQNADGGDLDIIKAYDGNIILGTKPDGSSLGNVGIGTTDPKNFKLAVAGSVIATSVTVKPQSLWPDYVFDINYNLPTLAFIDRYVQKNHHLPYMTSETEVAKTGINVGEILIIQTKKIEELTLYMVNQSKQLKAQQKQIQRLLRYQHHRH